MIIEKFTKYGQDDLVGKKYFVSHNNAKKNFYLILVLLFTVIPAFSVAQSEYTASAITGSPISDTLRATSNIDTFRVFTYNIKHGRGLDGQVDIRRIADLIKEKDPHLVTLQEVDIDVDRSGNINIMKVLSGYLGMEPIFYKNISHEGGEYGNGILTNLPLLSKKNLHFIQPRDEEQRGLLKTEVDFNGVIITLMTTHLDNRVEENRLNGVAQIIESKRAYRGTPVIVTGDFNDIPGSDMHDQMKEYFTDVWEEVGVGNGYTIPPINPDRRIDYFFYTNNLLEEAKPRIKAVHMEVIESEASDHLAIYAEFIVIPK
ncbi:MAG: endonuclease/exonuclease/phosphatase family protein [Balneolales bacterium]